MTQEQRKLLAAAKIIKDLNVTQDSQWLTETADSLEAIASAFPTMKRAAKKANRLERPSTNPGDSQA